MIRAIAALMALLAVLQNPPSPAVDAERLQRRFEELSSFGATDEGGLHRLAFSPADRQARRWLTARLTDIGAEVSTDAAGNLVARFQGTSPDLPAIAFGSHIDSVPQGGRFDGAAGVAAALEVVEALATASHRSRHPLEFVVFADEEGSMVGSRGWGGAVTQEVLDEQSHSGLTVAQGLEALGGRPAELASAARRSGSLKAFLELHVEQGAVLDRSGVDIGIVGGIVGIKWWQVGVEGQANHAGTTPMNRRRDALLAASSFVQAVHRVVTSTPGTQVGTVGRLSVEPGAANVVAGRVRLSLELRDLSMRRIDALFGRLQLESIAIATATGTRFSFELLDATAAPAPTDAGLRDLIESEAHRLGLSTRRMPSGAGHDAQNIARVAPIGMIFVPSTGGVSHSPDEHTPIERLADGARLLLATVMALDGE